MLGQLRVTRSADLALDSGEIFRAVTRHTYCDWGDLCEEDAEENNRALAHGHRLFSVYHSDDGKTRFYVITEADRSATTVLLPEDY